MWVHNLNPVFLSIGPVELRYYGLVYFFGFLFLWWWCRSSRLGKEVFHSVDDADDMLFYVLLGSMIGARVFYGLFYNIALYLENPLEILQFWKGGMSIHGGLLGGFLGLWYFTKKKQNYSLLKLGDVVVLPLAVGLFFGRIANFINGELPGRITSVSWGVQFPFHEGIRHPSQLYEAVKNLCIAGILAWQLQRPQKEGTLLGTFLLLYGILRFSVEYLREPEIVLGIFTMGQVLSLIVIGASIYILKKR